MKPQGDSSRLTNGPRHRQVLILEPVDVALQGEGTLQMGKFILAHPVGPVSSRECLYVGGRGRSGITYVIPVEAEVAVMGGRAGTKECSPCRQFRLRP